MGAKPANEDLVLVIVDLHQEAEIVVAKIENDSAVADDGRTGVGLSDLSCVVPGHYPYAAEPSFDFAPCVGPRRGHFSEPGTGNDSHAKNITPCYIFTSWGFVGINLHTPNGRSCMC